jgi:leader peptidase (prepilin peptidase)/N-methyltransferase
MTIGILILGLCMGSFLNVCIYRIPTGESIAYPSSHCIYCNTPLKPLDLLPIFSYFLYKGKCKYCGEVIPLQYPIVECLSGIVYLSFYFKYGLTLDFLRDVVLSGLLIIIACIDYRIQIIPNKCIFYGLILGIFFNLLDQSKIAFIDGWLGCTIGGGIFLLIALVAKGAMGGGDIKLMGVLGLWLGWKPILLVILLSFWIGAFVSIILIVLKKKKRKERIPFAPFIALSSFITMLYGEEILHFYLI